MSIFGARDKRLLNRGDPMLARTKLGTDLQSLEKGHIETSYARFPIAIVYQVTTGSSSINIYNATMPWAFEIVDVIIQCQGTSTNGTLKITNGTQDITDAMTCAVDNTMDRAATIDNAYSTLAADDTLEIVCAGDVVGSTKALVTIIGYRT